MGWWPFSSGGSKPDLVQDLDPKLRAFLERGPPVKYNGSPSSQTSTQPPQQARNQITSAAEPQEPAAPTASLYQDGRYAHLWKSYRPLAEIEGENATEHDKMMNVLEGYQERKAVIGRAALENCAVQQEEWVNCMKHGGWQDQLMMCKEQVRRYERCYTMQSVCVFYFQSRSHFYNLVHPSPFPSPIFQFLWAKFCSDILLRCSSVSCEL